MLEGLAAWVLNTYVGEYVENLNTDQLSIALLQGAVELDNLPLKKDALKSLGLPLTVKSGFIGKITLQIPLRRLHSEPWVISIERLYLVAGPLQNYEYDEKKEAAAEAARKAKLLEALEAKMQIQKLEKQESASWFSYGTSVFANILENLQLRVKDVHIRYEDDDTNLSCPFSLGIVINELSAQSTDGSWIPKFVSRDIVKMMHKLVDLKNFAVYFDTHTTLVGHLSKQKMSDALQREMYVSSITGQFKDHEYILSPVSAKAKMKRHTTPLPLRDPSVPRNTMDLNLESMAFALSEEQYQNIVLILREFSKYERIKRYRKWRPTVPVKNNARKWWKFAFLVHLSNIQERNKRRTKGFMLQRVKDVVQYTREYTAHLKKEALDPSMKAHQTKMEEDLSFDELKILRERAYLKLKIAGYFSKASTPETQPKKPEAKSPQEDKTVLQRWFPGWTGWYGSQPAKPEAEPGTSDIKSGAPSDKNVGEPPPKISQKELEQELSDVIEDVLGDGEDDKSVLKRDAVFAKLNFCLNTGSFKLQGTKIVPGTGDRVHYSILELECSAINMFFESRPRTSGLTFGLSVGGLNLMDKITENSHFPCLVGTQNKERFGPKKPAGTGTGLQKSSRIPTVMEESEVKLCDLVYEKNPLGTSARYRFKMNTRPLDIVYNKSTLTKVREVFSSKNIYTKKSGVSLATAARRRYETLKRQTQAEVSNTLTQLIEGTDNVNVKKWEIQLDISAPQIIIPENFHDENTSMVMLDLGNVRFHNTLPRGSPSSPSSATVEDEFLTPMSTPPNEPAEGQGKMMELDDLSQMNLTETEFYNKLYDQYTLELTDLQVMVGKVKDNWRHIHHKGSTQLHLVDRFSISLQLERRLIYTTDPQWPTIVVSGSLPSLTIHVNEHKVKTVNGCIQALSSPISSTTRLEKSVAFTDLSESTSGSFLEQLGESTPDSRLDIEEVAVNRKIRELLEESQLLLMQFSIHKLSLEIHSRDRAVAELQVAGVRTNLTKRPYDTAVTLTVHSLLVVDALQTYGPDFELLVASHRNLTLDSTSGSIRDSATTSPMAMSPRSPPSSPLEQLPPTGSSSSGALLAMQDVVSRALKYLSTGENKVPETMGAARRVASPLPDSEALITLEFEMISANSPSNTNSDGPLNVASFQFNNLDVIANPETIVEIVSFLKRAVPQSRRRPSKKLPETTINSADVFGKKTEVPKAKTEVIADFNRLSLLLMRLDETSGLKVAKKVATATMSCARVQATLDSELNMSGSLGGFHVYDITPEVKRHQRVFSVGQDFCHPGGPPRGMYRTSHESMMYKTAHESLLQEELDGDYKAFSFSVSKPLKAATVRDEMLNQTVNDLELNCVKVNLKVAALCYTHSPKTLFELSKSFSEFKEYRSSVAKSLKNVAQEVAKGMVTKRTDKGHTSIYGSSTSLDYTAGGKCRFNQSFDRTEAEFLDTTSGENLNEKKFRLVLEAALDSPVIVVPKSATSSQALVAHLGQISINNTKVKSECHDSEENVLGEDTNEKPDRIFMEVRNMNLYSVNLDETQIDSTTSISDSRYRSVGDMLISYEKGVPIMYNTTVEVTIDHSVTDSTVINQDSDTSFHPKDLSDSSYMQESQPQLDVSAKIKTPVKLVLSKNVYEQILQTTDYMSYTEDQSPDGEPARSPVDGTDPSTHDASTETLTPNDPPSDSISMDESKGSTTSVASFIRKVGRFEVPLFSVELRGDFGEGEQGIVELKLHRFLLDFKKDNPATSKIEVSLKSLVMDDLLVKPDSPHRQIMISKAQRKEDLVEMKPREFLSQSCPDNAIVAPVPIMPSSLPGSLYDLTSHLNKPVVTKPLSVTGAFLSTTSFAGRSNPMVSVPPCTPPPSPMAARRRSHDELLEEPLVYISVLLVDKAAPEYATQYNQTKRFIDVDFNCLDTKINQQTWVVLLDFLGLGAKVPDMDDLSGSEPTQERDPVDPDAYVQTVVNSEINLKVESLSIVLNKPEYLFSELTMSKLKSHISLRDGNFHMKGQLGKMCVLDLSPSGQLYRERFLTVGQQAVEFDFFKFGLPDPWLQREYDMKVKLRMASVRYTHTNKFQAELLGFVQHFLQLQDVLGRMRAASAGKRINDTAFHQARVVLDIEAGSPIILIPHSSRTTDVLVADLGTLTVRNCFKFDGDPGTFNEKTQPDNVTTPTASDSGPNPKQTIRRTSSQTSKQSMSNRSGIFTSRSASTSQIEGSQVPFPLTQSLFEELAPPRPNIDPMMESVYGDLDSDARIEGTDDQDEIYDPTDQQSDGSSVDPVSPRSGSGLNISLSEMKLSQAMAGATSPPTSPTSSHMSLGASARSMSVDDVKTLGGDQTVPGVAQRCLIDILDVRLSDMDLFAAERVEKRHYRGKNLHQDLEFPSCVIQRQGCKLLKEKCMLNLKVERNLEGETSHVVPDFRVQGALSSVHCCLDVAQYKLIRGLLDHNLGEKFENFKKDLLTHMQDPQIQTVLSGDVWKMISMSVDLNNVTVELVTSHRTGPSQPEVSLAKLDFVRSRLSYDLFSDQSKETDLVSQEILASDTRFRDVAINQRTSVFEKIIQPTNNDNPDCLQMELHFRTTATGTRFMVLLNNMKLLCNFDWLLRVQEFLGTKPENPFLADQPVVEGSDEEVRPPSSTSSGTGSRTVSPLTTSGGIITKRGPVIEQTEVPFELKLNVTETQFVVVENLASVDTNAVILKCTSVLSYRPKAQDKLLSCTLQSLEVFSCCLQAEDETALSIVDPMTISIELNANPLPTVKKPSSSAGLLDAAAVDQKQLLLEVSCNTMNVRLSYQDMRMFLAIMDSLPKQALEARKSKTSPLPQQTDGMMEQLSELGFSEEDCKKALKVSDSDVDVAAEWLLKHAKVVAPRKDELKITAAELNIHNFCLCLIDDCQDADVPLIELDFHGVNLKHERGMEGQAGFQVCGDYYNRVLSGWEPFLEQWRCQAQWKNYKVPEQRLAVEISASEILNVNITKTLLDLYNRTKDKWTDDYHKQKEESQKEYCSGIRRRQLFTPFAIRNHTGSPIWFMPVTMTPSFVGTGRLPGQKMDEAYIQATDWLCVPTNEEIPFNFQRKEKIRHKKSNALRVNQLVVKVDGWQRLSPLSVDKVGVYFRSTKPDISRPSIIKVNDQQPARVVFDIKQEGSARKVITLRSALMVSNKLDGPIEVKMDSPIIPGRFEYLTVNPNQQKPIPMTFVTSRLWIRPTDWMVNHCDQPIQWQHVLRSGEISESQRQCEMDGNNGVYRFCVAVRREKYPEDMTLPGLTPVPGHTIIVMPPVTLVNLLPIDLTYYFKGTDVSGDVKPGKDIQLHAADVGNTLELGIKLENFVRCRELSVPAGTRSYKVKIRLYDARDRCLELYVGILALVGGSLKLTISAPFWLVNRSGLPLVFRQDDARQEAAGQFDEHEMARIVSPLLFSFTEKESPYLCMMRIGKYKHGQNTVPQWGKSFALDKDSKVCQMHVASREGNRPDWLVSAQFHAKQRLLLSDSKVKMVYSIGIQVTQGKGQFRNTTIVTFSPRYQIDNQSGHKLAIAQRHFTNKEALNDPDGHLTALPSCTMPYHWPRQDLDQLLCVKLLDVGDCNWSGGFRINMVTSFHVNMRDSRKNSLLLKVEVLLQGQTFHVIFTDAEETPPPYRIDNMTEVPVKYYQTKTQEDRLRAIIRPQTSLPYAWDEPFLDPYLTLSVANGTTVTYNLSELGEGEQLSYQNFIYIIVTSTFPRKGSPYSVLQNKELVLDCEHDNHVVFRKREAGKRSQLWRMTSEGLLEHEGLGQPLDPRSSSSSRPGQRFVLDIADIALQPGKPVPLALKKADDRRAAKQRWSFKEGMLFCSTGNFCVQAVGGESGLQDGAIAVLGPGPVQGEPSPTHMQVSSQKLHPGSGCLTVRVTMDGPVRVVQINDIQQRTVRQVSNKGTEDWEIYEETLNHKTNEKRKKTPRKNIELDLNLKGGIGVSLVNGVPEEILYVALRNINLHYRSSPKSETLEMSVADIQADNQLLSASNQVMLFVTPTSKRDIMENTQALLISAHKVPNISWNAEIFKHLIISMKKLTVQLEEELLWKLVQFFGLGPTDSSLQKLEQSTDDLQKTLSSYTSVKNKCYYFGTLRIKPTCITLSVLTSVGGLSPDLYSLKRSLAMTLINFEDAKVDLDMFNRRQLFETKDFILKEIKNHYMEQLRGQAAKILGSVDFLGNPLGLVNDVAEGLSGLIEDSNVGGFAKGIFHGVSNSTAKVAGSLSDGFSTVHRDSKHNIKRQQIRSSATTSGGQIKSGFKGLAHGMYGGLKSVFKPLEGARKDGAEGFMFGLYEGVTGVVTKPVAGILDLASGMSNAVRDASRRSSHMQPGRVREPRCCHGPGGLLPQYSRQQAESQALLYQLNDHTYDEVFISVESVRSSPQDSLHVLITSHQVFFLRRLDPHKENLILNIKHSSFTQCKSFENDGRYYVELHRKDDRCSIPNSSNKKPQIRCDKKTTAQKVAQQINYAKNLFDEQKMTLITFPDDEDQCYV